MADNFTCPACGWPQGRTHTTMKQILEEQLRDAIRDGRAAPQWHPDGSAECPTCHQGVIWREDNPLAAPQGQDEPDFAYMNETAREIEAEEIARAQLREGNEAARAEAKRQGVTRHHKLTDAKEGEEDGLSGTSAVPANGNDERLARRIVTPDIAGLVRTLRLQTGTFKRLCNEAADALERMENERAIEKVLWERHSKRLLDELTAAKALIDTLHHRLLKEGDQYFEEAKSYEAEIERLKDNFEAAAKDLQKEMNENSRLRAALEKIATHHHPQTRGCNYDAEFARAALTGGEG